MDQMSTGERFITLPTKTPRKIFSHTYDRIRTKTALNSIYNCYFGAMMTVSTPVTSPKKEKVVLI